MGCDDNDDEDDDDDDDDDNDGDGDANVVSMSTRVDIYFTDVQYYIMIY